MRIDHSKRCLASFVNETGERAENAAEVLSEYRKDLSSRSIGRLMTVVSYSPPMDVDSTPGYAQDVAVIAVDPDKVDPASFLGNMTDLGGGKYGRTDPTLMMSRNPKNVHPFSYTLFSRQLGLRSIVPEEKMRKPVDYDEDGNSCIAVLLLIAMTLCPPPAPSDSSNN